MKIVTLSVIASVALSASGLVQVADKAGLKSIPESTLELLKLTDNPKNPITESKVELGKKLYFDPRLSKSGLISCNTCHNLAEGGDDGVSAAIGHAWRANPHHLNSPTVYNAVFFDSQFWDGRDPDLEKQAQGPILAAPEMAASKEHVVSTVLSMPAYVDEFKEAYGDSVQIDYETITATIATFERTLVTPSRFDDFLNGKHNAIDKEEKRGLEIFIDRGCASCHNGIALGGSMSAFEVANKYKYASLGDFSGDKNSQVKVPTLRNLSATAPYFHNGAIWSLDEAIVEMGRVQLGLDLNRTDVDSIKKFLGTLDGRVPQVIYPILPASTESTPRPDAN